MHIKFSSIEFWLEHIAMIALFRNHDNIIESIIDSRKYDMHKVSIIDSSYAFANLLAIEKQTNFRLFAIDHFLNYTN